MARPGNASGTITLARALGVALLGVLATAALAVPYVVVVGVMIASTDPFCGLSDSGNCTLNPDWTLPGMGIAVATVVYGLLATLAVRWVMIRRLSEDAYNALEPRPAAWAAALWLTVYGVPFIIGARLTHSYLAALVTMAAVVILWSLQLRSATQAMLAGNVAS